MQDPLSGTKAAADFITDMMTTLEGGQSELEKAKPEGPRTKDGRRLYEMCKAGLTRAGVSEDTAEKISQLYARDFDRRHPDGFAEGGSDPVEKTVSAAGMAAGLGTPSADVALTDVDQRRRGQG